MNRLLNINLVIILLIISICEAVVSIILNGQEPAIYQIASYNLSQLLNLYFDLTLFFYVTQIKKQKIYKWTIVSMIAITIYFWVTHYIPFPIIRTDITSLTGVMLKQSLVTLPWLLNFVANVTFFILLIKNTCGQPSNRNLKIIGIINLLIMFSILVISMMTTEFMLPHYNQILTGSHIIYILTLLNFYLSERRFRNASF